MADAGNWHDRAFFGLHYDQHANANDTVLGAENSVEHLVESLARVRPDWVQCDCKGHPGYTSWPTKVGSTSPGMVADQLAMYREATRRLGIPLGMHYSGVWDSRAIELHPEWARIDAAGQPDPNSTCRLSAYTAELLIPQMLELLETYDIDGFWVDGENWASRPCYCERCQAEFTRRSGLAPAPKSADEPHWPEWLAFHRDLFTAHVTAYADAVHSRKPSCLVCSNWMYTVRQPEPVAAPVDYLSGDFDWVWGADRAAVEGRVLDSRAPLSWDLMAWGFTKTGEMRGGMPWTMKTATHLCQEVSGVVALGGAVMVYNTPQRTGHLPSWHQDLLAEVAAFCRARQELCHRSETVPQAAVLHLAEPYYAHNDPLYNYGSAVQPIEGALHLLLETHRSADILLTEQLEQLHRYKLVVVPEQTPLSAATCAALHDYAAGGGQVILTGAQLAAEAGELLAVTAGGVVDEACWLAVADQAAPLYGPWRDVQVAGDTAVWGWRLTQQDPQKDRSDQPAVTCREVGDGRLIAVHGPLCRGYFASHFPSLRRWFANLVHRLGIEWQVEVTAPARLELVLRRKDGRLLLNLLNRGSGEMTNPRRVIVEELPPIERVGLRIRCAERPTRVWLHPAETPLAWTWAHGTLAVEVPRVAIHSVVVVEGA
ncbi:MAG: alpha-L-fucosidase [Fimbriimonadaceae bacterium]|nr:alpha-L-fucosidase [Fimbriimonadaceae bacterium]